MYYNFQNFEILYFILFYYFKTCGYKLLRINDKNMKLVQNQKTITNCSTSFLHSSSKSKFPIKLLGV